MSNQASNTDNMTSHSRGSGRKITLAYIMRSFLETSSADSTAEFVRQLQRGKEEIAQLDRLISMNSHSRGSGREFKFSDAVRSFCETSSADSIAEFKLERGKEEIEQLDRQISKTSHSRSPGREVKFSDAVRSFLETSSADSIAEFVRELQRGKEEIEQLDRQISRARGMNSTCPAIPEPTTSLKIVSIMDEDWDPTLNLEQLVSRAKDKNPEFFRSTDLTSESRGPPPNLGQRIRRARNGGDMTDIEKKMMDDVPGYW
ncbi:hypothetical protein MMC07_009037 [Pseudocyphellaria aurata]|nr:hypothetical protein [Pseudocyphellaria aurata]